MTVLTQSNTFVTANSSSIAFDTADAASLPMCDGKVSVSFPMNDCYPSSIASPMLRAKFDS